MDEEKTITILGAGVAGLSTALAAVARGYKVTLFDDPSPPFAPASQGLERIIRSGDYPDAYASLASEASRLIQEGPLSKYYTEAPRLVLEAVGSGPQRETFRQMKFEDLVGQYDDQPAGRINAADALACMKQMAVADGVIFIHERVTSIVWEGDVCIGVRTNEVRNNEGDLTNEGDTYVATSVLLAMGYQLPGFLADQATKEFEGKPITIVPGVGEFLPTTKNRILVNNARTAEVTDLEEVVRQYPLQKNAPYCQETRDLGSWFSPILKNAPCKIDYCADLITTNQHFLICPVPKSLRLYMGSGLSLHGWKFAPVIGSRIMDMIEGKLDPELLKLWSGSMNGTEIHAEVMPHRKFGKGGYDDFYALRCIVLNQD